MRVFIVILVCVGAANAYISLPSCIRSKPSLNKLYSTSVEHKPKNGFEELIAMILEALPLALRTPSKEMDLEKVIHNPPTFVKPSTASKFRKAHQKESGWHTQDIIDEFNAKYGLKSQPSPQSQSVQSSVQSTAKADEKKLLLDLLDELDGMELTDTVDKHLETNPVLNTERYIAEGVSVAFAPLDKPVNKEKVVPNPKRFVKPMSLREIKKKLADDPEYFKH